MKFYSYASGLPAILALSGVTISILSGNAACSATLTLDLESPAVVEIGSVTTSPTIAPTDTSSTTIIPAHTPSPTQVGGGGRIAFHSNRDENWEIYVINLDGSGLSRLTNNSTGEFGAARLYPGNLYR